MYVIEFSFNKIARVFSTAYYRLKKSTTDTFFGFAGFLRSFENFGKCPGKTLLWRSFKQIASLQITASSLTEHVCKVLENFWDNAYCGVYFYRSRCYQVLYQESVRAVLIMSVSRKNTEFYKGESDREVIVIAAKGLGEGAERLIQQAGFPIMGPLPSHQVFPFPMKVLVPPIVT